MANLGGANQFGGYELQPKWGDVKKATRLTKEAPISGAPFSALEAPRRAQRVSQGRQTASAATGAPSPAPPQVSDQATVRAFWQQVAQLPGASPLVLELAAQA